MGHTNDVGVESVAALQGELSEAQRAAAAAHSEHEHRVVGLAEEHRSQMESLHASEVALSASHDDAMQLLRTESMAALETVRAEQNEALDGAEVAVGQLHQVREAHDSLLRQKDALYDVIDDMQESAAASEAESASVEESHRSAMADMVAEHAEATEQAAMSVRALAEEREMLLVALILLNLHLNNLQNYKSK